MTIKQNLSNIQFGFTCPYNINKMDQINAFDEKNLLNQNSLSGYDANCPMVFYNNAENITHESYYKPPEMVYTNYQLQQQEIYNLQQIQNQISGQSIQPGFILNQPVLNNHYFVNQIPNPQLVNYNQIQVPNYVKINNPIQNSIQQVQQVQQGNVYNRQINQPVINQNLYKIQQYPINQEYQMVEQQNNFYIENNGQNYPQQVQQQQVNAASQNGGQQYNNTFQNNQFVQQQQFNQQQTSPKFNQQPENKDSAIDLNFQKVEISETKQDPEPKSPSPKPTPIQQDPPVTTTTVDPQETKIPPKDNIPIVEKKPAPKSWATLLAKNKSDNVSVKSSSQISSSTGSKESSPKTKNPNVHFDVNKATAHQKDLKLKNYKNSDQAMLANKLKSWASVNNPKITLGQWYIPHGFKNPGVNNCFINVVIQSLFACRPFTNFLKTMPDVSSDTAPFHNCLKSILKQIRPWDNDTKTWAKKELDSHGLNEAVAIPARIQTKVNLTSSISTVKNSDKTKSKQILDNTTSAINAKELFKNLLKKHKLDDGQHDAQEFLTILLQGASEEYHEICKYHDEYLSKEEEKEIETNSKWSTVNSIANKLKSSDSGWEQVDSKANKRLKVRAEPKESTTTIGDKSPIAQIFNGTRIYLIEENRLISNSKNSKQPAKYRTEILTANTCPFITFDINYDMFQNWSGKDFTLMNYLAKSAEPSKVEDYKYKDRTVENACQKMQIDKFPTVLILHLKSISFDNKTGESIKIKKDLNVPSVIDMPSEIVYKHESRKNLPKYQLFSIIYHHGQGTTTGHYTCDVWATNSNWWCNCDDEKINLTRTRQKQNFGNRTPYLLFYINENDIKT